MKQLKFALVFLLSVFSFCAYAEEISTETNDFAKNEKSDLKINLEYVKMILAEETDAAVNAKSQEDSTPLSLARDRFREQEKQEIIDLLIASGAKE
jgi:hypothetical protein